MRTARSLLLFSMLACSTLSLAACDDDEGPDIDVIDPGDGEGVAVELRFVTETARTCAIASPVMHIAPDGTAEIVTVTIGGLVRAFDADTGAERWRLMLDSPDGQSPIVLATPAVVDNLLVLTWQYAWEQDGLPNQGTWQKASHHAQVIDLDTGAWHPDFPRVQLTASTTTWNGEPISFDSSKHMARSRVAYLPDGEGRGLAYVSQGIGGGGQPYHGWIFELDLDAWEAGDASTAISSTLLTSADNDCAYDNQELLFAEVCGGGVWTPAGPLETTDLDGNPELILPTGNGRVHVEHQSYAHGLLRVGPGLSFDAGCDPALCTDFDEFDPSRACLDSCDSYFAARLPPGDTWVPENGVCDGETFLECYGTLDADFGSSAPVELTLPSGRRVLVHPAKDGAIYLIDRDHLGTLHDRLQAIETCGTRSDPCPAGWAGQFVTQPVVYRDDESGEQLVIASGFNFDRTHPAGVVAVRVVDEETPRLEIAWTAPDFSDPAAVEVFRRHTGRPVLHRVGNETYVFLVEPGSPGRLWMIRARDGAIFGLQDLDQWGTRYVKPLIHDETLYFTTCSDDGGLADGRLEAWHIVPTERGEPVAPTPGNDVVNAARCEPGGIICDDDEYCERQVCGGPGLCLPRPVDCSADTTGEVCGCDGMTYPSRCAANTVGVHVDQPGACQ